MKGGRRLFWAKSEGVFHVRAALPKGSSRHPKGRHETSKIGVHVDKISSSSAGRTANHSPETSALAPVVSALTVDET